jgi:hypothetical protein
VRFHNVRPPLDQSIGGFESGVLSGVFSQETPAHSPYNAHATEGRTAASVRLRGEKQNGSVRARSRTKIRLREEYMKNIGILTLVVLVTVLLTLAFSAAAAPRLATQPASVAAVPMAPLAAPLPQEHPEIHAALEAMHNAKDHLEHAAHDYNGHRVEAIKHLDAAIHEAEICEHMK